MVLYRWFAVTKAMPTVVPPGTMTESPDSMTWVVVLVVFATAEYVPVAAMVPPVPTPICQPDAGWFTGVGLVHNSAVLIVPVVELVMPAIDVICTGSTFVFVKLNDVNTLPVRPLLFKNGLAPAGAQFAGETVVPVAASTVEIDNCA